MLDAAIEVLGSGGLRRLTYQAVDRAAAVPPGTTSNHFRTRTALLDGVVAHLENLDREDWDAGAVPTPATREELARGLAEMVRHLLGPARSRTAARYALLLEGTARPAVQEPLARGQDSLARWGAEMLRRLGSPAPEEHCRTLMALLDGMMLHQLSLERPAFDPEPGIRTVLAAMLPERPPAPPGGAKPGGDRPVPR